MKTKNFFLLTILFYSQLNLIAQNTRLRDDNQIGWYNYFGIFKLNEKFGILTEYQLRRDNLITDKQQGLLRLGLNYQVNPNIQFRLGYAWIETYAYGDIPINSLGRNFTEHRSFQMITLLDKIATVDISHRFMVEQRWVGRYSGANATSEDGFPSLNRMRYMVRAQVPLKGKKITDKIPYFAAYNEIFIGFGKNVNENVFDQNRIGLLLGYQFNKSLRIEAGYLNQILQLGREINGQNVFQYNNGVIINTNFTFDLSKKTN